MRQRVRFCAARAERQRIQKRDRLFAVGDRIRAPRNRQKGCKQVVDGKIINDPELLLADEWADHFSWLAESKKESLPDLEKLQCEVDKLVSDPDNGCTIRNRLHTPFTAEEVTRAVSGLKLRKTAGPDGLMGECDVFNRRSLRTFTINEQRRSKRSRATYN